MYDKENNKLNGCNMREGFSVSQYVSAGIQYKIEEWGNLCRPYLTT